MNNIDIFYMHRALFLAEKGKYNVSPNPRVGAVIVHQEQIIGEGFHQQYGEAHAEVNAIEGVKDKSLLAQSTIYITLEPCSHHGKTPPCTDLILEHQFKRVVIATQDPFEKVNGSGIEKLKANGIEVKVGVLEEEAIALNKRFFTFHQQKRPYIILKWAETTDGFIGRNQDDPHKADSWITSPASKQSVHLLRAEEDGILVGKRTTLVDNPSLTCRKVEGLNPIRMTIDKFLAIPQNLKIFNEDAPTLIFNSIKEERKGHLHYIKIDFSSKESVIRGILDALYTKNILSLIVEGGSYTLQNFIDLGLWDEARVFIGNKKFGQGILPPTLKQQKLISKEVIGSDELSIWERVK